VTPLVSLIERTPGALTAVMDPDLATVLHHLGVEDPATLAAAAVARYDEPAEALRQAARRCDLVENLTGNEQLFASSRYEADLTNALVVLDPEPLARVLGAAPASRYDNDVEPVPTRAAAAYPLFPHQRRSVAKVQRHLATADTRVLLHMPTGAGKTRSAMNAVCDHLRTREPTVVVWAASTKELLEQAAREFATAWSYLGNRTVTIGQGWGGGTSEAASITDGFAAVTLQGLNSLLRREPALFERLVDHTDLMVFDEAHQAIAATYREVTDRISDRARLLGLSATPGRTATGDERSDAELVEFFQRRKVMLDTSAEGHNNPVRFLVEQGYLADTTFEIVPIDRPTSSRHTPSEDEVPDEVYTGQVVSLIQQHAPEQQRMMVFAASVDHAKTIAAASTGCGVPARYVVGDMGVQSRRQAIDWFKQPSDDPKVIVNYGVLATGFDAPEVSASIIARPTGSLVLYSQMVGRAIRGPAAGGTPTALVLTVVDSDNHAFSNVAAAFENWEQLWEDQS
jgi:DNA repair protein RadD